MAMDGTSAKNFKGTLPDQGAPVDPRGGRGYSCPARVRGRRSKLIGMGASYQYFAWCLELYG